jgi:hypothetical protein
VRVLQSRADPDLSKEALGSHHLSQIGMQDFERDGPVVPEVLGQEDGGHAAVSELALDPVPIGQRRLQTIQLIGHECLISIVAGAMANYSTSGCRYAGRPFDPALERCEH